MVFQGKEKVLEVAKDIADVEQEFGVSRSVDEHEEELKFGLLEVVHEWASGKVRRERERERERGRGRGRESIFRIGICGCNRADGCS